MTFVSARPPRGRVVPGTVELELTAARGTPFVEGEGRVCAVVVTEAPGGFVTLGATTALADDAGHAYFEDPPLTSLVDLRIVDSAGSEILSRFVNLDVTFT